MKANKVTRPGVELQLRHQFREELMVSTNTVVLRGSIVYSICPKRKGEGGKNAQKNPRHQHVGYTWNRVHPNQNIKGKSDLWKHFNLRKPKTGSRMDAGVALCKLQFRCQTCGRHLKHVNANEVPPSLINCCFGHLCGTNRRPTRSSALIGILTGILYRYGHRIPVCVPVRFLYRYTAQI